MTQKEFFIEILKNTPNDSFVETTGYIDYDSAKNLGLLKLKEFRPKSVGLSFLLTAANRNDLINYIKNNNIDDIVHYYIYQNENVIANGFDFFEINVFNKGYYEDKLDFYSKHFEISYSDQFKNNLITKSRSISLVETHEYLGNYSLVIITKITHRDLKLRFAIDRQDYDSLTMLVKELPDYRIEFHGVYTSQSDETDCGLTLIGKLTKTDIMIDMSKKLISNLLWFQQLDNEKDVEKLII
jgi:hypothetical protein